MPSNTDSKSIVALRTHRNFVQINRCRYENVVEKAINHKKYRLLKNAFLQGLDNEKKRAEPLIEKIKNLMTKLHEAKIDCIITRAELLLEKHLENEPRVIVGMADKLLKNFAEHTDVELAAHPKDAEVLLASLSEIALMSRSTRKVTVQSDSTFKRGSLVIKANKSIIDAHIKTQVNKAKEILLRRESHGSFN